MKTLDDDMIRAAIRGYQEQIRLIDVKVAQIERQLGGRGGMAEALVQTARTPAKRRISAAGRKRIAEAQRRRWAAVKRAQ